jgi:peptide/nickel transport system permease protein
VAAPRRFSRGFAWGAAMLGLLALVAVLGPAWIGQDAADQDLLRRLEPPSPDHWLGTDALGRDLAVRLAYGARLSLAVGTLATVFSLLLGLPLGALAGYRGGIADGLISRLIETTLCVPTLLLLLALVAAAPGWLRSIPDVPRISLVLAVTGWAPVARYARAEFLRLRQSNMVLASRALGASHWRVARTTVLPSALAPVLVAAAFAVASAIGFEAALSFLGLGIAPPASSWGGLLSEAREVIDRAWWLALFPGLALLLTIIGCNLVGEGLRGALDPRGERPRI